jgi:hypothetical protein
MDTKLCIVCKHYTLEGTKASLGKCLRSTEVCLVTGETKTYEDLSFCSTMRISRCGPEGKFFELSDPSF